MNALVADLLDVARIETGTLPVSPEPADAAALVDRARSAFASAGGRNTLAIDVEPSLPLVMADRRRIVQVLGNLLSNATRNSPESSVIRVSAARDGVHVAFSVSDQGRGIPADSLPDLFRKFSRAQSEEQGGDTGLGLAICKGIVEAHGGRIWAESDGPGAGASFNFTLPSVEDAGGAVGAAPPVSTRESREVEERVRVLAVDDDPHDLRYVRDTLVRSGYDPVVTGEPDEALRLLEEERPELVLLDLMLPGKDGIELMKDILDLADVPVIFLSVYGREEVIAKAFDMGAADYVVKPFSPDGAFGEDQGGPAETGDRRAVGALRDGRPGNRLRLPQRDPCRPSRGAGGDGVPDARRALGQRRPGADLSTPGGTGLGRDGRRRHAAHAHPNQQTPAQAGRRRRQPDVHIHRAPRRLPDAEGGGRAGESHGLPGSRWDWKAGSTYSVSVKDNEKVLDFIKSGGPILTIDRTIFELWLGRL